MRVYQNVFVNIYDNIIIIIAINIVVVSVVSDAELEKLTPIMLRYKYMRPNISISAMHRGEICAHSLGGNVHIEINAGVVILFTYTVSD